MSLKSSLILENSLYLLALVNPASKILFLASCEPSLNKKQNFELSWKSSSAALLMLVFFSLSGQLILQKIFHIEMYSLRVTGGIILFFSGWLAVSKGRFFERNEKNLPQQTFTELSIIPLAAPMITGPGSITLTMTLAAEFGQIHTLIVVFLAILSNFILMILALPINRLLLRIHLAGPLIRITGLIVATVAVQMVLTGAAEWLNANFTLN